MLGDKVILCPSERSRRRFQRNTSLAMRIRQIFAAVTLVLIALGMLAVAWLKWRGSRFFFPCAIEIRAARFLRNFAISRKERYPANPFANDGLALAK